MIWRRMEWFGGIGLDSVHMCQYGRMCPRCPDEGRVAPPGQHVHQRVNIQCPAPGPPLVAVVDSGVMRGTLGRRGDTGETYE